MRKIWERIFVGILSLVLVAAVCGLHPPTLHRISEPGPDFTYWTLDGNSRHISTLKGKVVFLDLWGTWCIQCVAKMPAVLTAVSSHLYLRPRRLHCDKTRRWR